MKYDHLLPAPAERPGPQPQQGPRSRSRPGLWPCRRARNNSHAAAMLARKRRRHDGAYSSRLRDRGVCVGGRGAGMGQNSPPDACAVGASRAVYPVVSFPGHAALGPPESDGFSSSLLKDRPVLRLTSLRAAWRAGEGGYWDSAPSRWWDGLCRSGSPSEAREPRGLCEDSRGQTPAWLCLGHEGSPSSAERALHADWRGSRGKTMRRKVAKHPDAHTVWNLILQMFNFE